jgi:FolB domain-containing protein
MDEIITAFFEEVIHRIIPGLVFIGLYYNQEVEKAYQKLHGWNFFVVACILIAAWLIGFLIDAVSLDLYRCISRCIPVKKKVDRFIIKVKGYLGREKLFDCELNSVENINDTQVYRRLWAAKSHAEIVMSRALFLISVITLIWAPNGYFAQVWNKYEWHGHNYCSWFGIIGIIGFGIISISGYIRANARKDTDDKDENRIVDLEVFYRVGVPDEERAKPQRLLLTVEMESDFSVAAKTDSVADTIDYFTVSQRLLKFGDGKSWKLIEKLAADICEMILSEFKPEGVTVEVKKFPIPQAQRVSVSLTRRRS